MKYIITENRLNKLIGKFLDSLNITFESRDDDGFVLYSANKEIIRLEKKVDYNSPFTSRRDFIYINYSFEKDIERYLNLNSDEVIPGIIKWFNKTYDVNITENNWTWTL